MLGTFNMYKNIIVGAIILILITSVGTYVYLTYKNLTGQIEQYKLNEKSFNEVIIELNKELVIQESNVLKLRHGIDAKAEKEKTVDRLLSELKAENETLRNAPPVILYKNEVIRNIVTGNVDDNISMILHNISRMKYEDF